MVNAIIEVVRLRLVIAAAATEVAGVAAPVVVVALD